MVAGLDENVRKLLTKYEAWKCIPSDQHKLFAKRVPPKTLSFTTGISDLQETVPGTWLPVHL